MLGSEHKLTPLGPFCQSRHLTCPCSSGLLIIQLHAHFPSLLKNSCKITFLLSRPRSTPPLTPGRTKCLSAQCNSLGSLPCAAEEPLPSHKPLPNCTRAAGATPRVGRLHWGYLCSGQTPARTCVWSSSSSPLTPLCPPVCLPVALSRAQGSDSAHLQSPKGSRPLPGEIPDPQCRRGTSVEPA